MARRKRKKPKPWDRLPAHVEALSRACSQNPDDLSLRLVLADAFEEAGEPLLAECQRIGVRHKRMTPEQRSHIMLDVAHAAQYVTTGADQLLPQRLRAWIERTLGPLYAEYLRGLYRKRRGRPVPPVKSQLNEGVGGGRIERGRRSTQA
jgi:uncharacterized protein (TIGR02996 family)